LIYTTGLRNSEINRIKVQDIVQINRTWWIDVKESKTRSGVRMVPLHPVVLEHLQHYMKIKKKADPDDFVFHTGKRLHDTVFVEACATLGARLKVTPEELAVENITFYSGRHYWKTLMNAHDLGDVEECFMGHKVSTDVAKRYNHRDKQGQKRLASKAREVFKILDKTLFKS
jgi:integrase